MTSNQAGSRGRSSGSVGRGSGFFPRTFRWWGGLLALVLVFHLVSAPEPGILRSGWDGLHLLAGWAGLLLPFVAFAGGLATPAGGSLRALVLRAAVLSLLAYALAAYVSPVAQYQAWVHRNADTSVRFPMGPETPSGLLAQRAWVASNPPGRYHFSTGSPLDAPPNWLAYLFFSPAALAVFAILSALLGWASALLTSGLSPPARANARWALGLASGIVFMVAQSMAGDWVRGSPSASAALAAWGPLLLPLLELLLLAGWARRRGCVLHAFPPSGVS